MQLVVLFVFFFAGGKLGSCIFSQFPPRVVKKQRVGATAARWNVGFLKRRKLQPCTEPEGRIKRFRRFFIWFFFFAFNQSFSLFLIQLPKSTQHCHDTNCLFYSELQQARKTSVVSLLGDKVFDSSPSSFAAQRDVFRICSRIFSDAFASFSCSISFVFVAVSWYLLRCLLFDFVQ